MGAVLHRDLSLLKPYPLFIFSFLVITAYIPGIIGASVPTGWLILLFCVPFFILTTEVKLGFGFLFICYAALSLSWTTSLNIGWFYFLKIVVLGCVFIIGQNLKDLKPIFKGLGIGLGVCSIIAIAQYFGFKEIYTLNGAIASTFINPNIYSEISAILLISFLVLKLWWFIPMTIPGLILVQSRAAFVGLGVGLLLWGWRANRKIALTSFAAFGIVSLYFYWNNFQLSSINERFDIWMDTIKGISVFGNGVGSYELAFPYYATHINTELARPKFAHNDLLQLVFEFGIGSILILTVLFNVLNSKRKETIIFCSIFAISMFTYPLQLPVSSFIACVVAGFVIAHSSNNGDIWLNWRPTVLKRIKI